MSKSWCSFGYDFKYKTSFVIYGAKENINTRLYLRRISRKASPLIEVRKLNPQTVQNYTYIILNIIKLNNIYFLTLSDRIASLCIIGTDLRTPSRNITAVGH